jgi:ATP-dependent DNA helicase RecG
VAIHAPRRRAEGIDDGGDADLFTEEEPAPPLDAVEIRDDAAEEDGQVASMGERRNRLGDPAHTGRPLAALGLDPALLAAFAEEGVETVADLLLLPPIDEEVLRPVHGAGRDIPAGRVAVGGRVRRRWTVFAPGRVRTEVWLQGAGPLRAVWRTPVATSAIEALVPGHRVVLVGDLEVSGAESVLFDAEPGSADGQTVRLARYGVEGVDDRAVRQCVARVLPEIDRIRDPLTREVIERTGLPSLDEALRDLHTLGSARPAARRRLAFDEALLVQLGLAAPRFQATRERGIAHGVLHGLASRTCQFGEFSLNDAQQLALEDIKRDLKHPAPMLRVVTGEAGAGKGIVAMLSAIMVAESKSQVLYVTPDAVSAELRYLFAEPSLREVGLVGRLVVGDPPRAQRDAIRRGEVHVIFGSCDLLERDLEFRRLGLVIGEESLTFGRVPARIAMMRAPRPDLLVLSSTPVPSAVLLSAYGDHDLSVIDPPVTRARPAGTVFTDERRKEAYREAAERLQIGRQAWVLFPMLQGGMDALDVREARRVVEALESEAFQGRRVALFHGAMTRDERWRAYDDFRHRRSDVLVATAPIEDGPPIPSATVAVIEQADRMGWHRLQRIRGHLAAAGAEAHCAYVLGQLPDAEGARQVEMVASGVDGWAIGEQEQRDRGLEEMLAREVPSAARLRWLDPSSDRDLLIWAREEAHRMLEEDPGLRRNDHVDVARALRDRWEDLLSIPYPLTDATGAPPRKRRRRRKRVAR